MIRCSKWLVFVAACVFAVGAIAWADDDEKVPLDKVPEVVLKAVKAKYPKAEIIDAEKGDQDGKKVYEFNIKVGDRKMEVSFAPDGKFTGSEEAVKEADLPAKVKEAFAKKYPGAKVLSAEKAVAVDGDKEKVTYEIITETDKGKIEAEFDETGKFIAEEKVKK
ncbi:MAG TPA: PepSY-like domain-containing protein [Gemmataceae bacterium]|nr:PepSY-like domain-containing protein [Gemmataceae bacterium]